MLTTQQELCYISNKMAKEEIELSSLKMAAKNVKICNKIYIYTRSTRHLDKSFEEMEIHQRMLDNFLLENMLFIHEMQFMWMQCKKYTW